MQKSKGKKIKKNNYSMFQLFQFFQFVNHTILNTAHFKSKQFTLLSMP